METKFTDLTKEQQEHFLSLLGRWNCPPDGATHFDTGDSTPSSWMRIGASSTHHWEPDGWTISIVSYGRDRLIPIPSPPYYNPEDVALNAQDKLTQHSEEIGEYKPPVPLAVKLILDQEYEPITVNSLTLSELKQLVIDLTLHADDVLEGIPELRLMKEREGWSASIYSAGEWRIGESPNGQHIDKLLLSVNNVDMNA